MNATLRLAAFAALLGFTAAAPAADSREARPVAEFTAIALAAPVDVHVALGDQHGLTLEGDPEQLARIETVVEGGKLRIRTLPGERNWRWKSRVTARVTARRIEALAIAGSGDIVAPALTGNELKVSIAGSGDVRVGGKVGGFTASIAGSGDIRADELQADRAKVTIAGSGDAVVRVRESLSVSVSGSGDVRYYGDPQVRKTVLGSGDVRRAGAFSS